MLLQSEELVEIFALSDEEAGKLLIGGIVITEKDIILLIKGDMSILKIPLSFFSPTGEGLKPDFNKFRVIDFGHAVSFGEYEAATDAILHAPNP